MACVYPAVETKEWHNNVSTFILSRQPEIPRFTVRTPLFSSSVFPCEASHGELPNLGLKPSKRPYNSQDMELLAHFISVTSQHLDARVDQVWVTSVVPLAFQYDYLMHAILTFSACHLQERLGHGGQWKYLEAYHLDHAIILYSQMMSKSIPYDQWDAAVATAFLLVYQAFATPKWDPSRPREDTLLSLCKGIYTVVGQWPGRAKYSIFKPTISPPLMLPPEPVVHGPGLDLIMMIRDPTLEDLAMDDERMELYIRVIESLVPLFNLVQQWSLQGPQTPAEQTKSAAGMLIWFLRWLTASPPNFTKLVEAYDPYALCIMSYYWAVADTQTRRADASYWWWKRRPPFMISKTSEYLGVKWAKWMAWPQRLMSMNSETYG